MIAGALFVWLFTLQQNKLKIDDVLGVWPLHGICGASSLVQSHMKPTQDSNNESQQVLLKQKTSRYTKKLAFCAPLHHTQPAWCDESEAPNLTSGHH